MMNTHSFIYLFLFLLLPACGFRVTPTASPVATVLTSTSQAQATSLVPMVTATVETPTIAVTEQTATLEMTATLSPTATIAVVQMTVLSDGQPTVAATQGSCQRPLGWTTYTVQASDTLSSLAQRTGTSWQQIQAANCLTGTVIFVGQTLLLPFAPAAVTDLPNPISPTPVPPGPGDPKLSISPTSGQPGTTFTIGMDDFPRNQVITLEITFADTGESVLKIVLTPNSDGDVTLSYISPQDAQQGRYNVYANSVSGDTFVENTGEFLITSP